MKAHRGIKCISPIIIKLGTRWRQVVNFTHRQLHPRRKKPDTHLIGGWMGPTDLLDVSRRGKSLEPTGIRTQERNIDESLFRPVYLAENLQ
jgi:hypothetical protein